MNNPDVLRPEMKACDCNDTGEQLCSANVQIQTVIGEREGDIPCCGPPAGPPSSPDEKPGYRICGFVDGFVSTDAGRVPRVKNELSVTDRLGTLAARIGFNRNDFKVAPGLYCTGSPTADSPVLVTANYKLSFDSLRKHLKGIHAWIIVLDTRGINVWCAAGKGSFGTDAVVRLVKSTGLMTIVNHRELTLPQLGATGVSALKVKKECGFSVVWGPVRSADICAFIKRGRKADQRMRRVTFSVTERLVLVPVEIYLSLKTILWILLGIFILSGIGSGIFSLSSLWERGVIGALALLTGVFAGAVVTPVLLPKLPGKAFAIKGAVAGLCLGFAIALGYWQQTSWMEQFALIFFVTTVSSFLAMNFTGSTPFTSPSGVEKEMRKAIPVQLISMIVAVCLWVCAGFAG